MSERQPPADPHERTPEELAAYIDELTRRIKENAEARRGRR